jgi:hypothetical protein
MVRFAGFRPDEAERGVDVAGPCKGDEQGLVAMVARLAHDKELAGGIGSHGRPFHAHFNALFASIGDQAGEDEAVGVTSELAEFVLMDAVDACPVLRMTVGTVFEGLVELGMHGGHREEHDSDMEPERHWSKEGYGQWRCQRGIRSGDGIMHSSHFADTSTVPMAPARCRMTAPDGNAIEASPAPF